MDDLKNRVIEKINSKKVEGYEYIFNNFYGSLCNFSIHFLGNKEDAEDIVQDVFLRLWKSDSTFDSMKALTSFLYLSVKNACLNAIRNRGKWTEFDISINTNIIKFEERTIEQIVIEEEFYRQIHHAISKLSPERRKTILLSLEGFTNKEIAEKTGVSINTVKTLKLKAYRFLKETLEPSTFISLLSITN